MCRRTESITAVGEAAEALARQLAEQCRRLCPDEIGRALKQVYDSTAQEPIPPGISEVMDRLQ